MWTEILHQLTPTTTDAMHLIYWVALVTGIAATFGLAAYVLTRIEDRIQRDLTDLEPTVEDPVERRRLHAIVEWGKR